jgi:hypothetical protein
MGVRFLPQARQGPGKQDQADQDAGGQTSPDSRELGSGTGKKTVRETEKAPGTGRGMLMGRETGRRG